MTMLESFGWMLSRWPGFPRQSSSICVLDSMGLQVRASSEALLFKSYRQCEVGILSAVGFPIAAVGSIVVI